MSKITNLVNSKLIEMDAETLKKVAKEIINEENLELVGYKYNESIINKEKVYGFLEIYQKQNGNRNVKVTLFEFFGDYEQDEKDIEVVNEPEYKYVSASFTESEKGKTTEIEIVEEILDEEN